MKNFKLRYLFKKSKCNHDKINPHSTGRFCPDCGKEIKIFWYIVRCDNCSTKREAYISFNTIAPVNKFCSKCGCEHYYVEKCEKLPFYDYDFAIYDKEIVEEVDKPEKVQVWVEEDNWAGVKKQGLIPISSR